MSTSLTIPQDVVDRIRGLCLALPEVTMRVDASRSSARSTAWSFDIRRRSFCLLLAVKGRDGMPAPRLVLRADPRDRAALVSFGHPYFSPHAGHRHRDRVGVRLTGETDWKEIGDLVTESYRLIAPKKLTAQLE
jgi:predicted DNA-binding protein (MmcQ/YjbR family)